MKKILSVFLVLALFFSLGAVAFATDEPASTSEEPAESASGEASGEASGQVWSPGGGSGGMGGNSNIAGMLSLAGYVVENNGSSEVSFDVYGIFRAADAGSPAAYVIDREADVNTLTYTVYTDRAMTEKAEDVTASAEGNVLRLAGVETAGNKAYYIGSDYAAETTAPTVVYVVNDRYEAPLEYTLHDGTSIALSEYAPGVASESTSRIYIGANTKLRSAADYGITDPEDAAVADWWLGAGITNAGITLSDFGDTFYRFELSVDLYRQFQIVIDQDTSVASTGGEFAEPADVNGAMGSNDQFSDSIAATLYAGVWDGLYTIRNDEGFLENIPGVTTFDSGLPVDEEFLFTALYNAFVSPWSNLNEAGRSVAAKLNAVSSKEKIEQIRAALGLEEWSISDYSTQKIAILDVLRTVDDYVSQKTAPGAALQDAVKDAGYGIADIATADIGSLIEQLSDRVIDEDAIISGEDLSTDLPTSLFISGGHVKITDSTISSSASNNEPGKTGISAQDMLQVQGSMPAMSEGGYNMTMANAYYRYGFGAGVVAWGEDTVVELGTTTGELVISQPANGSMAGGLYNAFGASYLVDGAVALSEGQHLSNTVYNGTIHYRNAAAIGGGRMFSSDFWGGNIVFENTVAVGGDVTDEPTAVIVKNSVFSGTGSMNGYASMYFENAWIEGGNFGTQNNTSVVSDAATLTLVNSYMNGSTLLTMRRSSRAVAAIVDSQIDLSGSVLVTATNGSYGPGNLGEDFSDIFNIEGEIYVYGTSGVSFPGDQLTVSVDEGQTVRLYVKEIAGGTIENTGTGDFEIVFGDEYGTLYLNSEYERPVHGSAEPAEEGAYPHFAEYQDYVAALVEADDFMMGQGAYEDTYSATDPYGIPFVDINAPIGAMDYPDWMSANYPGEAFPNV